MSKLAQALHRTAQKRKERRLYNEFGRLYDHSRPFGPDNVGVYDWQEEFCNGQFMERMLMAANQTGKTRTGGGEVACHLTGWYPEWWKGRRFKHPPSGWTGAMSNEASRDIIQKELLGEVGEWGTGWIPKECLKDVKTRQAGIPNVVDTITVKHTSGGTSKVNLKTYEQGSKIWMGTAKDFIWLDEQCPPDVYSEALTRLISRNGIMILTFTPLEGMTTVVSNFMGADAGQMAA